MRKMLISIAAPLLLVAAMPAAAQDQNQPRARDNAAAEQQNVAPERKICVDVELTGSRMNRRICRTAREWEERGGLERIR